MPRMRTPFLISFSHSSFSRLIFNLFCFFCRSIKIS